MEKILEALLEGIRGLGIEAAIMPQTVSANRPRIDLYFSGLELAGIDRTDPDAKNKGWERITFNAEFRSEGTHSRWGTDTILAARKLIPLQEENMQIKFTEKEKHIHLQAHWVRRTPGRFEYPEEEEKSMPVRYVEGWKITIAYPANIIGQGPEE